MKSMRISAHARERMLLRMGCAERKIEKVAWKAYRQERITILPPRISERSDVPQHGGKITFRVHMGYYFVFEETKRNLWLITVFLPPHNGYLRRVTPVDPLGNQRQP